MLRAVCIPLIVLIAAVALGASLVEWRGASHAAADYPHGAPHMYLDVTAPFCTTDDPHPSSTTVNLGYSYQVGICFEGDTPSSAAPVPPSAFAAYIDFNPALADGIQVFGPHCPFTCTDANPDLNDGFGSDKVGTGWACDGLFVEAYINSGPGRTILGCTASPAVPVATLTDRPGLLGIATYRAIGVGTNVMTFTTDGQSGIAPAPDSAPDGACGSGIQCFGATIMVLQADTPTPTPTLTPIPAPDMAIDADPANGSQPCSPIDTVRSDGPPAGAYQVAICLVHGGASLTAFEARVVWSGGVASAPEVPDSGQGLDDNPDFNDAPGPAGMGAALRCAGAGVPFPRADDPATAGTTDAHIICVASPTPAPVSADPIMLAMLTMQATGPGTESFAFVTAGGASSPCGYPSGCAGGTVVQAAATPTATATATPTSSPAPAVVVGGVGSFMGGPNAAATALPHGGRRYDRAIAAGGIAVALLCVGSAFWTRGRYARRGP